MSFVEPFSKILGPSIYKCFSFGSLILLLLIPLSSCSQTSSPWKVDKIQTNNPHYNSTRLVYSDKNARLELYRTANETVAYFSVTSLPVPPLPSDESKSRITLTIEKEEEKVIVHRISGGQKMILPETTLLKILDAMKKQQNVTLKTGRYSLEVTPPPKNELVAIQ